MQILQDVTVKKCCHPFNSAKTVPRMQLSCLPLKGDISRHIYTDILCCVYPLISHYFKQVPYYQLHRQHQQSIAARLTVSSLSVRLLNYHIHSINQGLASMTRGYLRLTTFPLQHQLFRAITEWKKRACVFSAFAAFPLKWFSCAGLGRAQLLLNDYAFAEDPPQAMTCRALIMTGSASVLTRQATAGLLATPPQLHIAASLIYGARRELDQPGKQMPLTLK